MGKEMRMGMEQLQEEQLKTMETRASGPAHGGLPRLLRSMGAPPVPPPTGPPLAAQEKPPPEAIVGQEVDFLVLD